MTGRFRLPMLEEQAYEYLLAAYIMEVQLLYRRFIYNGFVEEQLKQVANCLTANTAKFGIVLCGGEIELASILVDTIFQGVVARG